MIMFEKYQDEITKCRLKTEELKTQYNKISMLRLFTVAAAVISVAFFRNIAGVLIFASAAVFFVFLIRKHVRTEDESRLTEARIRVMQFFLDRQDGKWMETGDKGEEFISESRPKDTDLDLFGKRSVYQFICAARSQKGRKKTAERLSDGYSSRSEINARHETLREICKVQEFRDEFLTMLYLNDDKEIKLTGDIKSSHELSPLVKLTGSVLPPAGIILTLLGMAGLYSVIMYIAAVLVFASEFVICCISDAVSAGCLRELSDEAKSSEEYSRMIKLIENQNFETDEMKRLSDELRSSEASENLSKLCRISEFSQMRSNMIAFFMLNTFLMWDVHCLRVYEKWNRKNAGRTERWTDIIAEFEEITSFSVISSVCEKTVYPEILDSDRPEIEFKDLRHILIPQDKAVGNDEKLYPSVMIITGSNMSGKSTFLRSVGSSAVLAAAGAPVCAEYFRCSVMEILTSVRTQDSVTDGISAFYAEILRIKSMMDTVSEGKPALVMIDEIFKGTNTADRIICAREAVKKLAGRQRIVMVTTHDFELCDESYGAAEVINRHFSEEYDDGKIKFDYHMHEGKCRTANAQYLLRMAGII